MVPKGKKPAPGDHESSPLQDIPVPILAHFKCEIIFGALSIYPFLRYLYTFFLYCSLSSYNFVSLLKIKVKKKGNHIPFGVRKKATTIAIAITIER